MNTLFRSLFFFLWTCAISPMKMKRKKSTVSLLIKDKLVSEQVMLLSFILPKAKIINIIQIHHVEFHLSQ